jgi:hypothetical protein
MSLIKELLDALDDHFAPDDPVRSPNHKIGRLLKLANKINDRKEKTSINASQIIKDLNVVLSKDLDWHSGGKPMTPKRLVGIVDFLMQWIKENTDPTTDPATDNNKPDYKIWCVINDVSYRIPFRRELQSRIKNTNNIFFGKPLLISELFSGNHRPVLLYISDCHYGDGTRLIVEIMKRWGAQIAYESEAECRK